MPIGPLPPGCIAVCAPEAIDVTQDIPVFSGLVQFSSDGVTRSNVVVTSCTVTGVFFTEVSPPRDRNYCGGLPGHHL